MYLRPSDIHFCQDSINTVFDCRSNHSYRPIGMTLDDICEGRCFVSNIPTISVMRRDDKWVTADNRRLWVFRQLERLGKCDTVPANQCYSIPCSKLTSYNGGVDIRVRGNPGGRWYTKPNACKPVPEVKPVFISTEDKNVHNNAITKSDFVNNNTSQQISAYTRESINEESLNNDNEHIDEENVLDNFAVNNNHTNDSDQNDNTSENKSEKPLNNTVDKGQINRAFESSECDLSSESDIATSDYDSITDDERNRNVQSEETNHMEETDPNYKVDQSKEVQEGTSIDIEGTHVAINMENIFVQNNVNNVGNSYDNCVNDKRKSADGTICKNCYNYICLFSGMCGIVLIIMFLIELVKLISAFA